MSQVKIKLVEDSFDNLDKYLVSEKFKGFEYDDFLSSEILNLLTFNNIYLRILFTNFSKYSDSRLREYLGVKKLHSSKAFGFFIEGYLSHFLHSKDKKHAIKAVKFIDWLKKNKSPDFTNLSWGNSFDFASREGFLPKNHPTVVWTAHIARALDYANEILEFTISDSVVDCAEFMIKNVSYVEDENGICFSYNPVYQTYGIHNANFLVSSCLIRAWKYTKEDKYVTLASKAINWSLKHMNEDGSWPYSVNNSKRVDSYHTGYNLDCLLFAWETLGEDLVSWSPIEKTYEFWEANFFENSSIPKFYPWSKYPIDIQTAAQSIETMVKFSKYKSHTLNMALDTAIWTINNMQKENGSFMYRIYPSWSNNLETIHWGQATMLSALGRLLYRYHEDNQ